MAGLADYLFGGSTPVYQGPASGAAPVLGPEVAGMSPSIGAAITNRLPTMIENIARAYAGTLPDARSRPVAVAQPVAQPVAVQPQALPQTLPPSTFSDAWAGVPVMQPATQASSASAAPQGLSLRQALMLHQLMKPQLTPEQEVANTLRGLATREYDVTKSPELYRQRLLDLQKGFGYQHEMMSGGYKPPGG